MPIATSSPPEQGQLVTVRQRHYVVADVAKSTLPDRPLRSGGNGAQHLITLASVEDDALGEELQVIWELEPGAQIIEKVALPGPPREEEARREAGGAQSEEDRDRPTGRRSSEREETVRCLTFLHTTSP